VVAVSSWTRGPHLSEMARAQLRKEATKGKC